MTKFPVNSLFIRELPSETGSLQTACTATLRPTAPIYSLLILNARSPQKPSKTLL
jgi:hypothetical protein